MGIEDEFKTQETEAVVKYLARKDIFGNKKTPNAIATALAESKVKIYHQKVEKILSVLSFGARGIFGFEKVDKISLFWIKAEKEKFISWYKEWFGKDFVEKEG